MINSYEKKRRLILTESFANFYVLFILFTRYLNLPLLNSLEFNFTEMPVSYRNETSSFRGKTKKILIFELSLYMYACTCWLRYEVQRKN